MTDKLVTARELPLNEDRDAVRWAREFLSVIEKGATMDEGLMVAWFANAMMCGEDTYRWRYEKEEK